VPLVEQELLSLPKHLSVVRSLGFCVVLCRSLFVLLSFYLFAIVLSVLRFPDYDYPFGIFKLFYLPFMPNPLYKI